MTNYAYQIEDGQVDALLAKRGSRDIVLPSSFDDYPERAQIVERFIAICLSAIDKRLNELSVALRKPIGFCFLNLDTVNAFAAISSGRSVVVLHASIIPHIYVFYSKVSRTDLIKIDHEALRARHPTAATKQDINELWRQVVKFESDDLGKIVQLWDLVEATLTYIVHHELAHLTRGHLSLSPAYHEVMSESGRIRKLLSEEEALKSQTMEFDADIHASTSLLISFLLRSNTSYQNKAPEMTARYHRYRYVPYFASLIILTTFVGYRIFYNSPYDREDVHLKAHPPPYLRFAMAIPAMMLLLQILDRPLLVALELVLNWDLYEGIYCTLTGEAFDTFGLEYSADPEHPLVHRLAQFYDEFAKNFVNQNGIGETLPDSAAAAKNYPR